MESQQLTDGAGVDVATVNRLIREMQEKIRALESEKEQLSDLMKDMDDHIARHVTLLRDVLTQQLQGYTAQHRADIQELRAQVMQLQGAANTQAAAPASVASLETTAELYRHWMGIGGTRFWRDGVPEAELDRVLARCRLQSVWFQVKGGKTDDAAVYVEEDEVAGLVNELLPRLPCLRKLSLSGLAEWPFDTARLRGIPSPFPRLETISIFDVPWSAVSVQELLAVLDGRVGGGLQRLSLTWSAGLLIGEMEALEAVCEGRVTWVSDTALNTTDDLHELWFKRLGGSEGWRQRITKRALTGVLQRCPLTVLALQTGRMFTADLQMPAEELIAFASIVLTRLPALAELSLFDLPDAWPLNWDLAPEVECPFPSLVFMKLRSVRWTADDVKRLHQRLDARTGVHLQQLVLTWEMNRISAEMLAVEKAFEGRVKWSFTTSVATLNQLYTFWLDVLGGTACWSHRITEPALRSLLASCKVKQASLRGDGASTNLLISPEEVITFISVMLARLPQLEELSVLSLPNAWPFDLRLMRGASWPFPSLTTIRLREVYWTVTDVRELFAELDAGGKHHLQRLEIALTSLPIADVKAVTQEYGSRTVFFEG